MTTISQFIEELRASNSRNKNSIDSSSVYRWTIDALSIFGANILEVQEDVIEIKEGKAKLPDNFKSLRFAYKCQPKGYNTAISRDKLINTTQWIERTERGNSWDSCNPCCEEESEKVITEKVYIKDSGYINYYYDSPQLLNLTRTNLNLCSKECVNKISSHLENSISINKKTINASFNKGFIFISYYGLPTDDKGLPFIPDSPENVVYNYVEAYVYKKFYEGLLRNKADNNIITLFKFYLEQERVLKGEAKSTVNYSKLTREVKNKFRDLGRAKLRQYEYNFNIFSK